MDAVQAMTRPRRMAACRRSSRPTGGRSTRARTSRRSRDTGMPSFRQVLTGIAEAWSERRDEIVDTGGARSTESIARVRVAGALARSADRRGRPARPSQACARRSTARWGGFGGAPKFPQPMTLEFLLRQAVRGVPDALEMVVITLDRMAEGGIYDQVGGGFARYSTDGAWHVPHFEKMLYDNAQLVRLYTRDVAGHRRRALPPSRDGDGRVPAARDAASRGRVLLLPGRRLRRRRGQVLHVGLGGVGRARRRAGRGVLRRHGRGQLGRRGRAARTCCGAPSRSRRWRGARSSTPTRSTAEVEDARTRAVRGAGAPGPARHRRQGAHRVERDGDRALAEAGRAFDEPRYIEAATRCATFVLTHLRDDGGRLLRSWRNGVAGGPGFCDDHAQMAAACLTLYETTHDLAVVRRRARAGRRAAPAVPRRRSAAASS